MATTPNTIAYLGLGTNIGDREAYLEAALTSIAKIPATSLLRQSAVYESKPWGKTDQPDFLNMVAEISTQLEPHTLHRHLQSTERNLGREERGERWGPRPIDIDLLLYGTRAIETASLVVPHARLWERHFVLRPLADLVPAMKSPDGTPIAQLLQSDAITSQGLTLHTQTAQLT
jgi:2-amino-4-hydroxy-6-hydroxymethyldihydropteridine diphosphokinase